MPTVASGEFGAHMQVSLVNDGPVTFWLRTNCPRDDNDLTTGPPGVMRVSSRAELS